MKRFLITIAIFIFLCSDMVFSQTAKLFTSDRLSSNLITCICQDKAGYLWIGTEYGLNKFDGYRFTTYLHDDNDSTSVHDNSITTLFVDKHGRLVVGSSQGLSIYDYDKDCFHIIKNKIQPHFSYFVEKPDGKLLACTAGYGLFTVDIQSMSMLQYGEYALNSSENFFSRIYIDKYGDLWNFNNGPFVYKYKRLKVRPGFAHKYPLYLGAPQEFLNYGGQLMVICTHGLMRYDERDDRMVEMNINYMPYNINDMMMISAIITNGGDIYIGTVSNGIFCIRKGSGRMTAVNCNVKGFDLSSSKVRSICEDNEKNLWVGCYKKGLLFIPVRKSKFTTWSFTEQNQNTGGPITSICKGNKGEIFCSVQNNGIFKFNSSGKICGHPSSPRGTNVIYRDRQGFFWIGAESGLYRYQPYTGASSLVLNIEGETINTITDDGKGTLFVSDLGKGLKVIDTKTNKVRAYNMFMNDKVHGHLNNNWIIAMNYDPKGKLLIGTTAGLMLFSPENNTFTPRNGKGYLTLTTCNSLYQLPNGNILMGTNNGLCIFDWKKNKAYPYTQAKALRNKVIVSITNDNEGDLWFSTSMGIWQYDAKRKKYHSYINGNGLTTHEYCTRSMLHTNDDEIFYGTSDGITTFYPKVVKGKEIIKSQLHLTNIFIGGVAVNTNTLSNGNPITEKSVGKSDHFTISYVDNTFSMEFSLLNFGYADNAIYEYKLNGSKDWNATEEGKNTITFNHLQPGSYTMEVRACINGSFSPVNTYYINITPPWFSSTIAYMFYIIIFVAVIIYVFYTYNRHRREEMYEEKMKFIINATHDIRSPLTLIMGPLQKLIKKDFDGETKDDLNIIQRNAQRILQLVNQILDIRKLDKNQMNIRCAKTDMVNYLSGICKNYEFRAKECDIKFLFKHNDERLDAWIDRVNFDKVISNLLSNAFKYTLNGGEIDLILDKASDGKPIKEFLEIKVVDNGIGLRNTKADKLFERFYQGDNGRSMYIEGTGIGLNLCKMIVELHHGTIKAENRTDGQGTCITVRIPLGYSHLKDEELQDDTLQTAKKKWNNSRYHVLVVDDDKEIGEYIKRELGEYFRFHLCLNGKEALDELLKKEYHLVISDVMMPEMDGITLVKKIKNNNNISHIPVILLTSKTDIDNRLDGIEKGADVYMSKPFDMKELHAVINNLISNMLRMKGKFSGAQKQEGKIVDMSDEIISNDDQFMQRVVKSVNKNLSNSEFDVDMLSQDVGLSRVQLYRKMKDLTGIPTGEFIRNLRLEQAAKLLVENKMNVSQVAYTVGFNNQTHFSTLFRKHFGMSPSEYTERGMSNGKENDAQSFADGEQEDKKDS